MGERKLGVKPPRRPDVSGFEAPSQAPVPASPSKVPQRAATDAQADQSARTRTTKRQPASRRSGPTRSKARRRVHVTLAREVAAALRTRVETGRTTNTQVFIDAHSAAASTVSPVAAAPGLFEARRTPEGREGVYFYLALAELDHLAGEAEAGGFESRSAYFDALLRAHLIS
ncbi:MAG: hypothetical protein OEM97_01645 [Acidimicrobiia bacterium]|nr:hypothetical protein [Acidimicrobiia bacterium]